MKSFSLPFLSFLDIIMSTGPEIIPKQYLKRCLQSWGQVDGASLSEVYILLQARSRLKPRTVDGQPIQQQDLMNPDHGQNVGTETKKTEETFPSPPVSLTQALKEARHMVLVGEAGAGKTMTLQYLGLQFAQAALKGTSPLGLEETRLPIRIELKQVDTTKELALEKALWRAFLELNGGQDISFDQLLQWRDQGQLVVLMDALDEVPEERRGTVREAVNHFRIRAERCRLVVTTRPAGYTSLAEDFHGYQLNPLDDEQMEHFIRGWLATRGFGDQEADALWQTIRNQAGLRLLARTPMHLRMLVELWEPAQAQGKASQWQAIRNTAQLYAWYVGDAQTDVPLPSPFWTRARKRGAKNQDRSWALAMLEAWAWYRHSWERRTRSELRETLEETKWHPLGQAKLEPLLQPDDEEMWLHAQRLLREQLGILVVVGGEWVFSHLSWQEYFVARRLQKAWNQYPDRTWNFIKPRLHISEWQAPLHLLIMLLRPEQAQKFIHRVEKAGSPYEKHWRRDAQLALSLSGAARWPEYPLQRLHHKDASVRVAAIQALGTMPLDASQQTGVVQTLLEMQNDRDELVRDAAKDALEIIGPLAAHRPDEMRVLLNSLWYENGVIHRVIVQALGTLAITNAQETEVVQLIVDALNKDRRVQLRRIAAEALGAMGPAAARQPGVVDSLLDAIKDKDHWNVRQSAINALGNMGYDAVRRPGVIQAFLNALKDEDEDVRWSAEKALKSLTPDSGRQPSIVQAVQNYLEDDDWFTRQAAVKAIGAMGIVQILLDVLSKDEVTNVRLTAVQALKSMGPQISRDESVVSALLQTVDNDGYWRVRQVAVQAIGVMGSGVIRQPAVMLNLLSALKNNNGMVQKTIVETLKSAESEITKYPDSVLALLNAIRDGYWLVPDIVTMLLTSSKAELIQYPEVIRTLLNALEDENWYVRRSASLALGSLGFEGAKESGTLKALFEILHDEERNVREAAIFTLGAMGDEAIRQPNVLQALISFLDDEDESTRWAAASALGIMGYEAIQYSILPILLDAISRGPWNVRRDAVSALGVMAPEIARHSDVIQALIENVQNDGGARWTVPEALSAMASELINQPDMLHAFQELFHNSDSAVRMAATETLMLMEPKIVQKSADLVAAIWIAYRDGEVYIHRKAEKILEHIGPEAAQHLEVVQVVQSAFQSDIWSVQQRAIKVLGAMGPKVAEYPAVIQDILAALKNGNRYVRLAAAEALGSLGPGVFIHPDVMQSLLNALKDEDWFVRETAADTLKGVRSDVAPQPEMIKIILNALTDDHFAVREAAAKILSAMGQEAANQPGVVQALMGSLKDNDDVGKGAANALIAMNNVLIHQRHVIRSLLESLGNENWNQYQSMVLGSLGTHPDVLPALLNAIKNGNVFARRSAVLTLKNMGIKALYQPGVINALLIALRDKDSRVRWGAYDVLGAIDEREIASKVVISLRRTQWRTLPMRREQQNRVLKVLFPVWEAQNAVDRSAKKKFFDPLFPPLSSWQEFGKPTVVALGALFLFLLATTIKIFAEITQETLMQKSSKIVPDWSLLILIMLTVSLFLLVSAFAYFAQWLWRYKDTRNKKL